MPPTELDTLVRELRRLAERHMADERRGHTLQPTALVNEAWLKLDAAPEAVDRGEFLRLASRAMRQILVDHARGKQRLKRDAVRVALDDDLASYEERALDLVALDDGLRALDDEDAELGRWVELRFFGGLTAAEIAADEGKSERTVRRGLAFARGWLRRRLGGEA